jgi:predicted PurR-regulated permease PerM
VLAAIVTFVVLSLLKVPAALLLGIVAGILNFVPVIGIVLSLVPAVLLALTVSPAVAATVAGFYLVYNAVENYYIQPKVYGHEMQLSGLAVLAAFAVGAELGGIIGALIALPFAAMYPPIERLWLKESLPAAVEDHRRIEQTDEH